MVYYTDDGMPLYPYAKDMDRRRYATYQPLRHIETLEEAALLRHTLKKNNKILVQNHHAYIALNQKWVCVDDVVRRLVEYDLPSIWFKNRIKYVDK